MPKTKSKTKSKTDNFDLMEYLQLYHNSKFDLYIKDSQLFQSGKGVYTHDYIPANSFIDFYEGNLIEFIKGGIYYFQINDTWGIDGFGPPRCYMAMLNDANFKSISKNKSKQISISNNFSNNFSNNCIFATDEENLTVSIYSITDIEPESELFISYGDSYWSN
jgi:hypothetical protein